MLWPGWANLPSLHHGIAFGGGSLKYCNGETAKNTIINSYSWTFSSGKNCGNIAPVRLRLTSSNLNELNSIRDIIGQFVTTDQNQADLHTYSLVSGSGDADNASFSLSGNQLLAAQEFDFETKSSYSVRVEANDGNGGLFEQEFIITITNVKENQTITFSALADKAMGDPAFELTAISTSGLTVIYTSSDENVVTINGSTATIVGTGTTTITASQHGNDEFNAAPTISQELLVNSITSVIQKEWIHEVTIFPNPARSQAIVQHAENAGSIELYDATGKLLRTQIAMGRETKVELNSMPTGLYFVRLINSKACYRLIKN